MRALFAGEEVSHDGHVMVDRARLWTLPQTPPPLLCAAVSEKTARWGAEWADGLATVNAPVEQLRRMLDAFGPSGRKVLQVHVSWAPTDEEALAIAHDQWRTNVFDPPVCWDLDTPGGLRRRRQARAARGRRGKVLISSDLAQHVAWLQEFAALGFDDIAIHHVGQDLDAVHRRLRRARPAGAAHEDQGHQRPVVEGRRLLLPRRRDVLRPRRRRLRRPPRADRARRLPRRARDQLPVADAVLPLARTATTATTSSTSTPSTRRSGTLGDFTELVRTCRDRGIRVIADFVMNHTSDQHPWFQAARSSPDSPYRDFYVWARRAAAGEARRRRLPGPGDLELGL